MRRAVVKAGYPVFRDRGCGTVPDGSLGFTLLELMVAMLLVSMVTTIMATAFRMSINAWDRAEKEGDTFQARGVIPNLLSKQLKAVVKNKIFVPNQASTALVFKGRGDGLSFFTAYTPMAGSQNGLLRVTYIHDQQARVLYLYQQLILSVGDLEETLFPLSDRWNGELEPAGSIPNVEEFKVSYAKKKGYDPSGQAEMQAQWMEKKPQEYPGGVQVEIRYQGPGIDSASEVWHFTVGT